MKTKTLPIKLSILLFSLFSLLSWMQSNYQEQYKYFNIVLVSSNTESHVECLFEPDRDSNRIHNILAEFWYSTTNPAKQLLSYHSAYFNIYQYNLLETQGINLQNLVLPPKIALFHRFISVLHKSQPSHSSEEDIPSPINS